MSASLRKAALTLHGLTEEDRSWILGKLPAAIKLELKALIAELNGLGFDASVLAEFDAVADLAEKPVENCVMNAVDTAAMRIEKCPLPLLVEWVNEEEEWVVAQVLAQRQWSWAAACLAQVGVDKRACLSRLPREIRVVPALLGERLLMRLADLLESRMAGVGELIVAAREPAPREESQVKKWLRSFVRRG